VVSPDPPAEATQRFDEYRALVPASLNLKAISVLDKEIFNADLEADWRAHFAELSQEELRALNPEIICAGLRDRVERLTRAYTDEIARRRPKPE
jgi:predicted ATPase